MTIYFHLKNLLRKKHESEILNVNSPHHQHQNLQGVLLWGVESRHFVSYAFHIPEETSAYRRKIKFLDIDKMQHLIIIDKTGKLKINKNHMLKQQYI